MYMVCLAKLIKLGYPSCLHKLMKPGGELQNSSPRLWTAYLTMSNMTIVAKTKIAQFIYGNRRDTILSVFNKSE